MATDISSTSGSEYIPSDELTDDSNHDHTSAPPINMKTDISTSGSEYIPSDELTDDSNHDHTSAPPIGANRAESSRSIDLTALSDHEKRCASRCSDDDCVPDSDDDLQIGVLPTTKKCKTIDKGLEYACNKKDSIPAVLQTTSVLGVSKPGKRNCCYYCGKYFSRISRHLLRHTSENLIIRILSMKPARQAVYLKELKLKGNYKHNVDCLSKGKGNLLVVRCPRYECNARNFLPCPYCYGFFAKRDLQKHCKICSYKLGKHEYSNPVVEGKLMVSNYVQPDVGGELSRKVLLKMRSDQVKDRIVRDPLVLSVGNALVSKLEAAKGEKYHYVSNRMRNLGRLLLEYERIQNNSVCLEDILVPTCFDSIVNSVKHLSEGDKKPNSFGLKIGYDLRKACMVGKCRAVKRNDNARKQAFEDFLLLMDSEWSDSVSSSLLRRLYDKKLNKDSILPLTSDLLQMTKILNDRLQVSINEMLDKPSLEKYFRLAKLILCKIITFNKRRGGEVSRITVKDFLRRSKWCKERNEEVFNSLSSLEKRLVEKFELVKIHGKRGRHVPVLLTPEVLKGMEILVRARKTVGIKEDNAFFFANSGNKYLRGHDVLQEFLASLKLENPSAISSTNLRKYVATVSQIVSLEKEELEWVADHLGHNIEVHREFYRLQDDLLEMSKVSKLLMSIEQGSIHKISGKKLSEITLEDCFGETENLNESASPASLGGIENLNESESPVSLGKRERTRDRELESSESKKGMLRERSRKDVDKVLSNRFYDNRSICDDGTTSNVTKAIDLNVKRAFEEVKLADNKGKKKWNESVKKEVLRYFNTFISSRKVPGKKECEKFLENKCIGDRTWKDVKYLVYNTMKSNS